VKARACPLPVVLEAEDALCWVHMPRSIGLIGVPSSAGAHWPGQEKAPGALRTVGLIGRLEDAGLRVDDHGDLPHVRFRPDKRRRHQQNLSAVIEVTSQVADRAEASLRADQVPLVLGGDCTIELGVLAGCLRSEREGELGLLYVDGHVDLNTPLTSPSGILDSMGVAHMVAEEGTAEGLSRVGPRFPLMPEGMIVLFGYNPRELNDGEAGALARRQMPRYPLAGIRGRAEEVAAQALAEIEERAGRFLVHLDVDVIDFTECPIADVPQQGAGLEAREVISCLKVFVQSPKFSGLTITEINPDHADEEGALLGAFAQSIVEVLSPLGR
jgi:arginase